MFGRSLQAIWSMWKRSDQVKKKERRGTFRPFLESLETRTAPAVLTVNSVADNTVADAKLTLREAILLVDGTLGRSLTPGERGQVVGTLGDADTIQFKLPKGPQTIGLSGGALGITSPVSIQGLGAGKLTINGSNLDRVFVVGTIFNQNLSLVVSIDGVTISGGKQAYGAGLLNFGTLAVSKSVFSHNTADTDGGAIYNVGALTLTNCTFKNNSVTSTGGGGAIENNSAGTAFLTNCCFVNNSANGSGSSAASGASITNSGKMTVHNSTFDHNTAASNAGGIFNSTEGSLTVRNSVFTNNSCGADGGAIDNDGILKVDNVFISKNTSASEGGGINNKGTLDLTNSLMIGNTAVSDGGGLRTSGPTTIKDCIFTGNRATVGSGGIFGGGIYSTVPTLLSQTVVAGNVQGPVPSTTPSDIAGTVDPKSAHNFIGTGGSGGLVNGVHHNVVGRKFHLPGHLEHLLEILLHHANKFHHQVRSV